jgi:dihydrofolate reductase
MRKIILNLAISLDGYISDPQGGFGWIKGHNDSSLDFGEKNYFESFLDTVDIVVMGSKSYEDTVLTGMNLFEDKQIIVITSRKLEKKDNVRFIKDDVVNKIYDLKKIEGKSIYLFGGAMLADALIKANLIDEYIIGIVPTILGDGKRLFKEQNPNIDLHLESVSVVDGVTLLKYRKR